MSGSRKVRQSQFLTIFYKAGDVSEVLGQLTVDQLLTAALGITNSGVLTQNSGNQQSTAGSVGGTATFFAPIWGTGLKVLIVQLNGWNSASVATYTFPSALTWAIGLSGNLGSMTFGLFIGSTAQTVHQVITSTAGGTAGTDAAETVLRSDWLLWLDLTSGGATSIQTGTTGGSAITAPIIFIGN